MFYAVGGYVSAACSPAVFLMDVCAECRCYKGINAYADSAAVQSGDAGKPHDDKILMEAFSARLFLRPYSNQIHKAFVNSNRNDGKNVTSQRLTQSKFFGHCIKYVHTLLYNFSLFSGLS